MYAPDPFKINDLPTIQEVIRNAPLANFVTATADGLLASPLPLFLDASEGEYGALYGHMAKPNPQWKSKPIGEALAIFMGPDAYISPAYYAAKRETGRVVPTWNYVTAQAYGRPEFFEDAGRLRELVSRLTDIHEAMRPEPWKVTDAPEAFIEGLIHGIVGLRMPITRLEGKCKASQNRSAADRAGVLEGLSQSYNPRDRDAAKLTPR
jgi:transcriptional regulator